MKISRLLVAGALLGTSSASLWAQGTNTPVPKLERTDDVTVVRPDKSTSKGTYRLHIRNVRPSLIAYWLDPAHHPVPTEVAMSQTNGQTMAPAPRSVVPDKNVLQLPAGIEQIVAVDPQSVLLVTGTPEGMAELRRTVAFLDRPLRQVEVEAQFVSVAPEDEAAFGVDFTTARSNFTANSTNPALQPAPGTISLGFVRGNFAAALTALQNVGKVKVLSAPRVTAINNLTATLQQTMSVPAMLGTLGGDGKMQPLADEDVTEGSLPVVMLTRQLAFTATPTINNDNTVTLRINVSQTSQLSVGDQTIPLKKGNRLDTICNVRDGETIALAGLDTSLSKARPSDKAHRLLLFVTARIVHQLEDEVQTLTQP